MNMGEVMDTVDIYLMTKRRRFRRGWCRSALYMYYINKYIDADDGYECHLYRNVI